MRTKILAVIPLCLWAFGCDLAPEDEADGGPGGDHDAEDEVCEESGTVLGSPDEVSEIVGFSANDLLAAMGAPIVSTAMYQSSDFEGQSPAAGSETEATLTVSYEGGVVTAVDSTPVAASTDMDSVCYPYLVVEVAIDFTTADGAFAESWEGELVGYTSEIGLVGWLRVEGIAVAGFAGAFVPGESSPALGGEVTGDWFAFDYRFDAASDEGTLTRFVESLSDDGETMACGMSIVLSWGGEEE